MWWTTWLGSLLSRCWSLIQVSLRGGWSVYECETQMRWPPGSPGAPEFTTVVSRQPSGSPVRISTVHDAAASNISDSLRLSATEPPCAYMPAPPVAERWRPEETPTLTPRISVTVRYHSPSGMALASTRVSKPPDMPPLLASVALIVRAAWKKWPPIISDAVTPGSRTSARSLRVSRNRSSAAVSPWPTRSTTPSGETTLWKSARRARSSPSEVYRNSAPLRSSISLTAVVRADRWASPSVGMTVGRASIRGSAASSAFRYSRCCSAAWVVSQPATSVMLTAPGWVGRPLCLIAYRTRSYASLVSWACFSAGPYASAILRYRARAAK